MREVLFRGKQADDGEWVYGVPYRSEGLWWILVDDNSHTDKMGTGSYHIIPETVGQYTGLKDKNGVEIYEGDVVHIAIWGKFEKPISEENAIVVFENGRFGMHRGYDWHLTSFDSFCDTTFEVIGSIHEGGLNIDKSST